MKTKTTRAKVEPKNPRSKKMGAKIENILGHVILSIATWGWHNFWEEQENPLVMMPSCSRLRSFPKSIVTIAQRKMRRFPISFIYKMVPLWMISPCEDYLSLTGCEERMTRLKHFLDRDDTYFFTISHSMRIPEFPCSRWYFSFWFGTHSTVSFCGGAKIHGTVIFTGLLITC